VELHQGKHSMRQSKQKVTNAQVATVIEERQKTAIQARQRTDAQYYMQKEQSAAGAEARIKQSFGGGIGFRQNPTPRKLPNTNPRRTAACSHTVFSVDSN
jgi:hypothetical protein